MPYSDTDLGQRWPRLWLGAWQHQAITWTSADLSSVRSIDKHLKATSQEECESLARKSSHPSKTLPIKLYLSLRWRHNNHDGVWNHQPHGCLLNHLFRWRSKKTSKLHVTVLCAGNSPGPVNSPHKGPVTRKMFPFDDVIMTFCTGNGCRHKLCRA